MTLSNRVSSNQSLCFRETELCAQRRMRRNTSEGQTTSLQRPRPSRTTQPIRGLFGENREISVRPRVRGGPGRIQTSNQPVMRAATTVSVIFATPGTRSPTVVLVWLRLLAPRLIGSTVCSSVTILEPLKRLASCAPPSPLQKIRLSSDRANPLNGSRNGAGGW